MPYLTVADYVRRFGVQETRLFTNLDPDKQLAPGVYDEARVETAISDATDEVEGYVARRYAVPIASPPTIVKGWVAAFARRMLAAGTGRVSDVIRDESDRATRQLERLVDGKLDLPVPEGGAALPELSSGSPMSSNDRDDPTFTREAMADFIDPFRPGSSRPRWLC